jgi:VanZ family protein
MIELFNDKPWIRYQLPVILWGLLIFVSSSLPSQKLPNLPILGMDKAIHFGVFFVFALLTHRAIKYQDWFPYLSRHALVYTVPVTILYGVLDEVHQMFVPGRDASVYDLVADGLGAILYVILLRAWMWYRPVRVRSETPDE